MNKLIQITVAGVLLQIEEQAYDMLKRYLDSVAAHFRNTAGSQEILRDIEARLAELFMERSKTKGYVAVQDVEETVALMGKPSDMDEGQAEEAAAASHTASAGGYSGPRRLFRDPSNKVLGGVCSGVANYFDIDPVWFRAAFAVSVLVFGTGVLLYIILWVIIPEARSSADFLQMKGEKVNLNNIEKTVREEWSRVEKKMTDFKDSDTAQEWKRNANDMSRTVSRGMGDFFQMLGKLLGKVLALFLVMFAVIMLISFIMGYFSLFNRYSFLPFTPYASALYTSPVDHLLAVLGLSLLVCVPLIALIVKGISLLFGLGRMPRFLNYTMGVLWLSGIVLVIIMAVRTADLFKMSATQRSKETIKSQDTLYVQSVKSSGDSEYTFHMNFHKHGKIREVDFNGGHIRVNSSGDLLSLSPEINVSRSSTDKIEIEILRTASGPTVEAARTTASQIPSPYQINGQVVEVLEYIPYTETSVFRNQQVTINLRIPVGKVVVFDPSVVDMLETPDEDMDLEGKSYKMTDKGLVPLNGEKEERQADKDSLDM